MKPIHKFNNGVGATLCHQCNCIASLGYTEDLYCKECNKHRKELLIEIMRLDESIGLYIEQAKNEEPKQRLEKYSERFDNDKSLIGNPDTWGKRIVEEPKQKTLEEVAENYKIKTIKSGRSHRVEYTKQIKLDFISGAKWQQEQDNNKYSEQDIIKAIKFGANGMYGYQIGEEGCFDNQVKRFLEQFKTNKI